MNFSTINESSLHNTLKKLYSFQENGKTEVELDGHVYDILTEDNNVIEIQTKNLSKLLPKLLDAIEKGHKVKVVHTVVINKTIILKDTAGNIISKRKSPKKGSIYSIFRELTGIYPILLNPNFSLDVLEINISEYRVRTEEKVQSRNKQRRFLKNWIKTNNKLDEILMTRHFCTKDDYLALLPQELNKEFCAKDLTSALLSNKNLPASASWNSHLIIWVFVRMNLLQETQKQGRTHFYKISED